MLGLILFGLVICTIIAWILCFAIADADLTLLGKGPAKQHEIEDKVVWITGASQGIGEALAKEFSRLGAKLILSSRREAELERVKAGLSGKNAPSGVMILPMDLAAGAHAIEEAIQRAESFFNGSGVDYMVHNAAHERPKTSVLETSEEALQATIDVNVLGTITLTRHLAPFMLKRGRGHFVVMSSAAGKVPSPGQAVYAASKHAVNGYFHTLRSELAQKGIKVTVVCPGPIEISTSPTLTNAPMQKKELEKRVSVTRCVELTVIATTHGLREVWISKQERATVFVHLWKKETGPGWRRRQRDQARSGNGSGANRRFITFPCSLLIHFSDASAPLLPQGLPSSSRAHSDFSPKVEDPWPPPLLSNLFRLVLLI